MVKDQILRRGVLKSPSNTCATPLRLFAEVEYVLCKVRNVMAECERARMAKVRMAKYA